MKVLWLAPYPINSLDTKIEKVRDFPIGTGLWLVNLLDALKLLGLEIHILTRSPYIVKDKLEINNGNLSYHIIKDSFSSNKGYPYYFPYDVLSKYSNFIRKAKIVVQSIKPDLVHSHGTEGPYALLGTLLKYPHINSIQGIVTEIFKSSPNINYYFQKKIEKYTIYRTIYFGCRTLWDKSFVLSINPSAEIFNLPEAINPVFFQNKWKPHDNKTIMFVGSVIRRKGIEVLLKALVNIKKVIPDIRLIVIGSGELNYIILLKQYAFKHNIDKNIEWLGKKDSNEIAYYLSTSSLFVLPTFMDNSPNSLAEAMAIGIPSIASSVGGIPSMLDDGLNGFLTEKANHLALAEKIISVLLDFELCKKISESSRQKALDRNFPENVSKITFDVYNKILK
jgi:L-malate glycosyltransferase